MARRPRPDEQTAAPLVPERPTLPSLRRAAAGCRACPLWERGTQTVFGEGPPAPGEVRACAPWLEAELRVVRPRAVVCLGATAAQSLLGRAFKVTERRGELLSTPLAPIAMATVHPSSILRAPDDETRRAELARFTEDLAALAAALRAPPPETSAAT